MSTISRPRKPSRAKGPRGQRLWCIACATDEHLSVESVQSLEPPRSGLVNTAYTCGECGFFYSHPATVSQIAVVLNRPVPRAGVLQFGGTYFHCGEPMPTVDYERCSIHAPVSTEQPGDGLLEVYLCTKVLRCSCGFKMEIPD